MLIDRVLKNWRTTLVGVVLIVVAALVVVLEKATLEQAGLFMVTGFGLFFAKNKKNTL